MKKSICFFLLLPTVCFSQYFDIGASGGTSYYIGDLNSKHFNQSFLSYSFGTHYRVNFGSFYSLKTGISFSKVLGDDAESENEFNRDRNLRFSSTILEFSEIIEFNFLPFEIGNPDRAFTPYIFIGGAIFKFNPTATYTDGVEYDLQFLGTEGQQSSQFPDKKKYTLTQFAIPFGIGIKANISTFMGVSLEWGIRKTFTDYIDDVGGAYPDVALLSASGGVETAYFSDRSISSTSKTNLQRGDSNSSDWYSTTTATIYFSFGKKARYSCFSHKNQ